MSTALILATGIGTAAPPAHAIEDIGYGTPEAYENASGERIEKFHESPTLSKLVVTSDLPPVEQRLPREPLVLKPVEQVGKYGGTWKNLGMGAKDSAGPWYFMRETLIAWSLDGTHFVPNVAKAWEVSEDAKSFTFYLREGMKWSDGAPFTADDFVFWYEDVVLNDELTPVKDGWLLAGGKLGKLEKVNDYTIRFSFAVPNGVFLAMQSRQTTPALPKHYLQRFHPQYSSLETIQEEMNKRGFDRVADQFNHLADRFDGMVSYSTPETPQISAWFATNTIDSPVFKMVRNPYYWKIDTAGNQLPYIDKIHRFLVPSEDAMAMKIIAGEFTHHNYRLGGSRKYFALLYENQSKGNYRLVRMGQNMRGGTNLSTIFLNYHHEDPILRTLFLDIRFRIALSVAINREEINDVIYDGDMLASQFSGGGGTGQPFWNPELDRQYAKFDPHRANRLLDEVGLHQRDRDGYRKGADGKRLVLVNSVFKPWPEENVDVQELVGEYWNDVGLYVIIKPVERSLWSSRVKAAEHEIATYAMAFGVGYQPPTARSGFFPFDNRCNFAPMWGLWFNSEGKSGEEPPQPIKDLMNIHRQIKTEPSIEMRNDLARKAFAIHADNIWMIGIITGTGKYSYRLASNTLRNENGDYQEYFYIASQFYIDESRTDNR